MVERCDSFAAETNVHHPTDFNLLRNSVRCLLRETARACGGSGVSGWQQWRHRRRNVETLHRRVNKSQKWRARPEDVRAYPAATRRIAEKAQASLAKLQASGVLPSRYRFRGATDFAFWILTTRMAPPVAVLFPFFVMYVTLGLNDTHIGLVFAHVALNLAIVVWHLRGFFEDLPFELEEAEFMDGATHFQAFRQISLPLAAPGIGAVGILSFLFSWNEFLFALVLADEAVRTVPVGIYGFVGFQTIAWGNLFVSVVLMILPVVLFITVFQRSLIRGLTLGAVK